MGVYGQFCPVAKAMEILDERWTMLIVRELLEGSHYFNDLRRGVPKMSPSLLSKRLRSLARAGLVIRDDSGPRTRYELTPGGRELASVVAALGSWGVRWMTQLGDEDLDPHLLMWDIHRNINLDLVPDGRTVIRFAFTDVEPRSNRWWLVIHAHETVDLCDVDPGLAELVGVTSALAAMTRIWRGDVSWEAALRDGALRLSEPLQACQALPTWLKLSAFAAVPRVPDHEKRIVRDAVA